jgi:hypothetical protein
MAAIDRATFDHIGVVTTVEQPGETFVPATRVWVTNPRKHPYNVELLRFEPDSPLTDPVWREPHVAYRVADIAQAIEGHEVLAGPFEVGVEFATVAFVRTGGAVVEFMQYRNPDEEGWF